MSPVRSFCFHLGLVILGSPMLLGQSGQAAPNLLENYGKLPLRFEANQGQTDAQVKFLSRGGGYSLFLTNDEAIFSLRRSKAKTDDKSPHVGRPLQPADLATTSAVLRLKLVNPNPSAKISGEEELASKSNYFIGNDPKKWSTNVTNYAKVKYEGVYSGIDLVYYGNQRQLEYDFIVAPGGNPSLIQFNVTGAKRMRRDGNGDLVLQMAQGEVRWHKPVVYQEKNGARQDVAAHYVVKDKNRVEFAVASYDPGRKLFIDPLIYSTYLGGSQDDLAYSIAVDSSGNAYVAGRTYSPDFPTMNPFQPPEGGLSAFVTKFSPSGSLVYSTYLGNSAYGQGIAVDSLGSAYVTGGTDSPDFPTVNALQPTYGGGPFVAAGDAFVAKLNPAGSGLVYSTYLGGSGSDQGSSIAVDSSGNAYVTGFTGSTNFPVTPGALEIANCVNPDVPCLDAFVSKLDPSGSALVYSTYLGGGSRSSEGLGIAVDSSGDAYVTGETSSTKFPTMNPIQPALAGFEDAFVTKLDPSGSALIYSTYLGGSLGNAGYLATADGAGIAVDTSGNAYVVGTTNSSDFPLSNPLQATYQAPLDLSAGDAFVSKLNPSGSALVYSTYLGSDVGREGQGIALDSSDDAYVAGFTASANFPTTPGAFQTVCNGGSGCYPNGDVFVSEINPAGSALVYSTFYGGSGIDSAFGIAVDSVGSIYVTGFTDSTDLPTLNPVQPYYGGGDRDAFVFKLSTDSVTITGAPQQPITRNGSGDFVALVTLTNTGNITITSVQVTIAGTTLGSAALLSVPAPVTNLAPGASATVSLTFPDTAALSKATAAALKVSGTYSVPAVPLSGHWALSFRSLSL